MPARRGVSHLTFEARLVRPSSLLTVSRQLVASLGWSQSLALRYDEILGVQTC
jgi:hypothetical protein